MITRETWSWAAGSLQMEGCIFSMEIRPGKCNYTILEAGSKKPKKRSRGTLDGREGGKLKRQDEMPDHELTGCGGH